MTEAPKRVAILGYGNQGAAHALNLRDAGVPVIVGARAGREAEARAKSAGFDSFPLEQAARRADVVVVLLPDEAVPGAWPEIAVGLHEDTAVVFAHGFNLLYGDLAFPARADVVLVSPTGPGRVLRMLYEVGEGLPAYLAVHRDGSGAAWALAERYATWLGCARSRLLRTTVREETEVDLFGEQAVLCGGMNALVAAAFDTLVQAGYSPEIAYLECVHQLKYLADLLHERGPAGLRRAISGTALYGDLTRGPRIVDDATRRTLAEVLAEVRSGAFAREWRAEVASGRSGLDQRIREAERHPIEAARRRALGLPESDPPGPGAGR